MYTKAHRRRPPRVDHAVSRTDEGGFVLLESMISITLITIILAALTTFYITATDSTTGERTRQSAILVADTELDLLRGVQAGDLPLGRTDALVSAQFGSASAVVSPWLSSMSPATDTTTTNLSLPMSSTTTVAGTTYTTTDYLGWCYMPPAVPTVSTACSDSDVAKLLGTRYLRAVVAVTWGDQGCASGDCTFVDATLISAAADPVFTRGHTPPNAPIITNPGDQTSAVNDDVGLQLSVAPSTGVGPYTWQVANLPAGLSMTISGQISGKPTTATPGRTVIVTVTDAFLRTATATFRWTVLPDLIPGKPGSQTSYLNNAIDPVTFTATGGSGAPYTWTDPRGTLPAGLTMSSAGIVTGVPTRLGTSTVSLTVKDSSGRVRTLTFSWTVTYLPLSAPVSNQVNQVARRITSLTLTAVGGSGNYSWTDPNGTLPPGLSLSRAGVVTGTPTTLGTYAVKLLVTDTQLYNTANATFTWSVVAPSSITGLTNPFTVTTGATIASQALTYDCPTAACTYSLTGAPNGIGLGPTSGNTSASSVTVASTRGTIYLGGTVTGAAGSYTVKVTPVDNVSSAAGTPATAAWAVFSKPTVSGLTALKTSVGATIADQALTYACPSANCTYTFTSGPDGIGLDDNRTGPPQASVTVSSTTGTIYIRGTIAASNPTGSSTVTITGADNSTNAPVTTTSKTWTLVAPMLVNATPAMGVSGSPQSAASTYSCAYGTCTLSVSGQPSGIGIGATSTTATNNVNSISVTSGARTAYVSGSIANNSAGTYTVVVTITDAAGSTVTASSTWLVWA